MLFFGDFYSPMMTDKNVKAVFAEWQRPLSEEVMYESLDIVERSMHSDTPVGQEAGTADIDPQPMCFCDCLTARYAFFVVL